MLEVIWLLLAAGCFTAAAGPRDWDQWLHEEGTAWTIKFAFNVGALFFLNLYLGEALS